MKNICVCKAKRIDNGEWVIGNLIITPNADKEYQTIIIPPLTNGMYTVGEKDLGFEAWYKVAPDTICRCVGIEDKTEMIFVLGKYVQLKGIENFLKN